MRFKSEWQGSTDPDDKSGVGIYTIDCTAYFFRLTSFNEYETIHAMLDAAFVKGERFAVDVLQTQITYAIAQMRANNAL